MGMGGGGGGGGNGRRRKMGGLNEINVTPLIDVMLVLLVIFMVTAPLLTTGVQVDLPKVKSAPMQTDDSKLLLIVTADEHVYLGKDEITSAIEDRLKLRQIDEALATSVPASLVTLRGLVARYPTHALSEQALWRLADLYEAANRHRLAAEACETLARTFPATGYDAWFRAAELYDRRVKDKDRARAAYTQVPPSSPKYKDAQKKTRQ